MDVNEKELIKIYELSVDNFLSEIGQKKSLLIFTMYDILEKSHIMGGFSANFPKLYSEKEIQELRNLPIEVPSNSLMEYAINKIREMKTPNFISIYRVDCETETIYEYDIDNENNFIKYDNKLPDKILMGNYQKVFVNNIINKLGGIDKTIYKQYYFIPYVYHLQDRYIAFLNLFSSIMPSQNKAKKSYLKIKSFLLDHGIILVLNKLRLDNELNLNISETYKRLSYMFMHEENGAVESVLIYLNTVYEKYPEIKDDESLSDMKEVLYYDLHNIRQFISELSGDDPLRNVPKETIYENRINILDEIEIIINYLRKKYYKSYKESDLKIIIQISDYLKEKSIIKFSPNILFRIIKQLIKNAVQIGAKRQISKIKIIIDLNLKTENNYELLIIKVIDNCGGIEEKDLLGKISFDKFNNYLVKKYFSRNYRKGTGFLTILRYTDSVSGLFRVDNCDNGCEITIIIPLKGDEQ